MEMNPYYPISHLVHRSFLVIACTILFERSVLFTPKTTPTLVVLTGATMIAYLLILVGMILCIVVHNPVDIIIDVMWMVIGAVLFAAVSQMTLAYWEGKTTSPQEHMAKCMAILAMVTAAIMIYDAVGQILLSESPNTPKYPCNQLEKLRPA